MARLQVYSIPEFHNYKWKGNQPMAETKTVEPKTEDQLRQYYVGAALGSLRDLPWNPRTEDLERISKACRQYADACISAALKDKNSGGA